MTDNFHLAQKNFVQFIYNSCNWQKPRGITMVHIIAIGAGGGGGGGHTAATGSAKSGGGGGASGAVSRLYIPANLCPENCFRGILMSESWFILIFASTNSP